MEELLEQNKRLIYYLADKFCYKYNCKSLKKDLVQIGNIVVLQKHKEYIEGTGATFSTFIYPFLVGSMKREVERYLYPLHIPKDEFKEKSGLLKTNFISLASVKEKNLYSMNVEREILNKIYIECVFEEFEKMTFKEKQILGGFYGVFGYTKQTLSELAEEFQMKENALQKAKDNALEKLSYNCFTGRLEAYRRAVRKIRKVQKNG